jgi:hypothetical protein
MPRAYDKLKKPCKIKTQKVLKAGKCAQELNILFNCWRNSGLSSANCALETTQLAKCMAKPNSNENNAKQKAIELNKWLKESFKGKQV